jgi:glycosyltransferase involved in cell wall biosynthesis
MKKKTILFLSTYPPRECGIATFTENLVKAMDRHHPDIKARVMALDLDQVSEYNYESRVTHRATQDDIVGYITAAKRINESDIDLVNIQHEFGIFGGKHGDNILTFLELLKKPSAITFHTVLPQPDQRMKAVVDGLTSRCRAAVVMTRAAKDILLKDYSPSCDIVVLPHGIPDLRFVDQAKEKKKSGYADKKIITSFGLVNPSKGYEYVIGALKDVVKKFPDVLYIIAGKTHPVVSSRSGEDYRNSLIRKVKKSGLVKNVRFYNKYMDIDEIIKYLRLCDTYMSTSLSAEQVSSGTLSYAMGVGRATISTPFLYAQELVTPDRGRLVNFKDARSYAKAIKELLSDDGLRKQMERNAYEYTRSMTWKEVSSKYVEVFRNYMIREISLTHLEKMTDSFAMIQFSKKDTPDIESGYTLDDNARALMVFTELHERFREDRLIFFIEKYLNFIEYVHRDGRLYNYVNKERQVDHEIWSADAHGRALWSLGYCISSPSLPEGLKEKAKRIFLMSSDGMKDMSTPRSLAFSLLGLYHFRDENHHMQKIREFSDRLVRMYKSSSTNDWRWFEHILTYDNSILSMSLLYSYLATQKRIYRQVGLESLNFLMSKTFFEGTFVPIGQDGWYEKDKERALFDQQPIEVASTVLALKVAYMLTRDKRYKENAQVAFTWFNGNNLARKDVFNSATGGSYDGLHPSSVNLNQGAESTLSYFIARLALDI